MYCKYCGSKIDDDSNFCKSCGKLQNSQGKPEAPQKTPAKKHRVEWYYVGDGKKAGPYTRSEMLDIIACGGIISPKTYVWRTGFDDWVRAGKTSLFTEAISEEAEDSRYSNRKKPVPSVSEVDISDKWLWLLACIPLIIIVNYEFTLSGKQIVNSTLFDIIVFVANTIAIIVDKAQVEGAGFDLSGWSLLGFILVPIYIGIRVSKTKTGYAPLIIWCLFFIAMLFITILPKSGLIILRL